MMLIKSTKKAGFTDSWERGRKFRSKIKEYRGFRK
jgi:hypothetical protein